MSYRIDLRPDLDLVLARGIGEVTEADIESALDEIPRRAGFRRDMNMIVDFRGCTTPIGWSEVRHLSAYAREREAAWGRSRWAIIVDSDLIFGLVRIFVALANKGAVRSQVFRDAEHAAAWLTAKGDAQAVLDALAARLAENEAPHAGDRQK